MHGTMNIKTAITVDGAYLRRRALGWINYVRIYMETEL